MLEFQVCTTKHDFFFLKGEEVYYVSQFLEISETVGWLQGKDGMVEEPAVEETSQW